MGVLAAHCNREQETAAIELLLQAQGSEPRVRRAPAPASAKKRPANVRAAIVAEYEDGAEIKDLAAQYGVHRVSIYHYLDEAGIARRVRFMKPEQAKQAIQLYTEGASLAKVGERLGFAPHTVERALRKHGVALRDTHGRDR